jgi:hypothetical protein
MLHTQEESRVLNLQFISESLVCSFHEFYDYTKSYREVEKELKEWMGDF